MYIIYMPCDIIIKMDIYNKQYINNNQSQISVVWAIE